MVILGMDGSLAALPVMAELVQGVQRGAEAAGVSLVLCDIPDPARVPKEILTGGIDGAIVKAALQGSVSASPAVEAISGIPHVWLLGRPAGCIGDACGTDDPEAGRIVARHLLAQGHRRLAVVNPKPDHILFASRQRAFEAEVLTHGALTPVSPGSALESPPEVSFPVSAVTDIEQVRILVHGLLSCAQPPSGIFVPADNVTVLVYRVLAEAGLAIGRDISVVSCNCEQAICSGLYPALTTVDIHAEAMGRSACHQLLWRMANPSEPAEVTLSLAPTLVLGQSSGPPLGKEFA